MKKGLQKKPVGRFRPVRKLGQGGMGQVWQAEDREGDRAVALKFLHPGLPPQALSFFKEEARLLTQLSHPNLVKIFDFFEKGIEGEEFPPGPCISMEYVEGQAASELTRDQAPPVWIDLFVQLAQGLHYLHNRQILHRDLKPSNVLVTTERTAKILDFGLATLPGRKKLETPMGTLAYMPPEAFWGEYDSQSDLFSLGVLFYELLTGRLPFERPLSQIPQGSPSPKRLTEILPHFPEYFSDLIHRLIELQPARRPSSALSLIRFLNQHVSTPFPILDQESSETILRKAPLVGREDELHRAWNFFSRLQSQKIPGVLVIKGPTGVGRTRLLEELKWRFQLEGIPFQAVASPASPTWLEEILQSRALSGTGTGLVSQIQALFKSRSELPSVFSFPDLQNWEEGALTILNVLLARSRREGGSVIFLLEFRDDAIPPSLEGCWDRRANWPETLTLELGDLNEAQAEQLVGGAAIDSPLPAELIRRIAHASGGRPLLAIEAVRHFLQRPGPSGELTFRAPANLRESIALRVDGLKEGARRLLARVAVHSGPLSSESLPELFKEKLQPKGEIWELERKGFLKKRNPTEPQLELAHPSLRPTLLECLPAPLRQEAHRSWIDWLLPRVPEAKPSSEVVELTDHALAVGDEDVLKKYGIAAAEYCQGKGKDDQALGYLEKWLEVTQLPQERSLGNAHLAPILYRLGRFEEALAAYDRWFADRVDDKTFLQKVKHRFYTGLVYFTWGKEKLAEERLKESLAIGNSERFPPHRPYHVRAYNLLAALSEKWGRLEEARAYLEKALPLARGMPLQLGEIEQRFGRLEQLRQNYPQAEGHFSKMLQAYRESNNPQAEAIAQNALGILFLEQGDLARALPAMQEALDRSQKCGDLLQSARYQENLGLVYFELSRLAEALREMASSEDLLVLLGKEEDRVLLEMHRADLYLKLGNWDQALARLRHLQEGRSLLTELGLWEEFLLLRAEWAYLTHRWEEAEDLFGRVFRAPKAGAPMQRVTGALGWLRSALRTGKIVPGGGDAWLPILGIFQGKEGALFATWTHVLTFLSKGPQAWDEAGLVATLQAIKEIQRPEARMDLYSLFSHLFEQRGLANLSLRLKLAAQTEFAKILSTLPEELKMDFEKNRSLDSLDKVLGDVLPTPTPEAAPPTPTAAPDAGKISENRFRQYSEINRQIAQKTELNEILERVMDAAIELTGAERGFLLLKGQEGQGQMIKGFEVKTARHLNQRSLSEEEFQFSMTAVRQAVDQGTYLITDNAQLDPRLQQKTSVMQLQLKSILAVPLELEGQVLGCIYLDHRYQPNCFSTEDVTLLTAFASQAALAIQKAQMLAELKRAKERLEVEVKDQARHIEVLTGELAQMRDQLKFEYREIVGQSPPMMQVFQMLDHVTETTIPVWIWGESGTGKELIARSLHFNSPRKGGPFVTENCSSIPETLLESELFGHKKGAFTHADRDRIGLFEQAHGGTLFLDEIADMSLAMQAKMLRVLQEGEIRPVGSSKKIKIDVRLVTASNRDLNQMVKDEKFRQDLFFRLNGMTVKLPPLRERKEDIPLLVAHMIKKIAKDFNLKPSEVTDDAYQVMFRYPWPGNIRELEGVIRNALLFAKGRPITPDFLSLNLSLTQPSATGGSRGSGRSPQEEQSEERQMILDALKRHQMEKERVAEELGISLRSLYTRLEKLGIPKKKTLLAKYLGLK